jgi:transposase-like protein
MLEVSITWDIPNFDKEEIDIQCPICKLENPVQFGEIRRRECIICRGCHSNIFLEDHLGTIHRFIKSIDNLENLL